MYVYIYTQLYIYVYINIHIYNIAGYIQHNSTQSGIYATMTIVKHLDILQQESSFKETFIVVIIPLLEISSGTITPKIIIPRQKSVYKLESSVYTFTGRIQCYRRYIDG